MSELHIRLDGFVPVGQARPRACAFRRGDGSVTARVYEPSKSAAAKDAIVLEARRCIQAQGWKCIEAGGKDYCPKCKPRRKPRRSSRTTVRLVNAERKTGRG